MAGRARSGGDESGWGRDSTVPTHARLHGVRRNGVGGTFPLFFISTATLAFLSFVIPLVRITSSRDRPGRRAKGSLQRAASARTADWKRIVHTLAMI